MGRLGQGCRSTTAADPRSLGLALQPCAEGPVQVHSRGGGGCSHTLQLNAQVCFVGSVAV